MSSVQQLATINFLVPAYGQTNAVTVTLPGDGNIFTGPGSSNYGIDFKALSQVLQGLLFIPQACTIDTSNLSAGSFVTFLLPQLQWKKVIPAGMQITFQFPALADLQVTLIPSSGTPQIPTYWYNYPALPDSVGDVVAISGSVLVTGTVTISQGPEATGTDNSANAPALLAHKILTINSNASRKGFLIQNLDTSGPIQVALSTTGSDNTVIVLNAATIAGNAGGEIDGSGIPHSGQIDVYSATAAPAVSAREW